MRSMRSVTGTWYESKIRYDKTMEDGSQKKVTETYVVNAVSWGEAEKKTAEEMASYVTGEMDIKSISPATYKEILFSDHSDDDKWYKAKVAYITLDEKTEKEKKTAITYLVQAHTVNGAIKNLDDYLKDSMSDYTSMSITETKIMDVYE